MTDLRPHCAVMRLFLPAPNYSSVFTPHSLSGCNNASVTQSVMTHLYHCQCHYTITSQHYPSPVHLCLFRRDWIKIVSGSISVFFNPNKRKFPRGFGRTVTVATAERICWLFNEKNFPFHLLVSWVGADLGVSPELWSHLGIRPSQPSQNRNMERARREG